MRIAPGARTACPSDECEHNASHDAGNVVFHGYSKVNGGRRRRYRRTACGKTFGIRTGMPYQGLQHAMTRLDRVAALSVEGVNKSAIARLEGLSWNTVARRLELAAALARRFNAKHPQLRFRDVFTARDAAARIAVVRFQAVGCHGSILGIRCAA